MNVVKEWLHKILTPEVMRFVRRHAFAVVMLTGSLALMAWIGILATTLPDHHSDKQWKAAWVGFDVMLVLGMLVTAVGTWQRRQYVAVSCIVTSALLVCDAWFDIVLDWGTPSLFWSVLMAVVAELPLAAFLFYWATRLIRQSTAAALRTLGHDGPVPSLWKLSITHFDLQTEHQIETAVETAGIDTQ
ncbi:MAG TPA: hypothetical protein VF426_12800 [Marmoricola sp.]